MDYTNLTGNVENVRLIFHYGNREIGFENVIVDVKVLDHLSNLKTSFHQFDVDICMYVCPQLYKKLF